VDHHHNTDVKTATKVRFQEPGKEGKDGGTEEVDESNEEETKEVRGKTLVHAVCPYCTRKARLTMVSCSCDCLPLVTFEFLDSFP
jgi:hypothetical protein